MNEMTLNLKRYVARGILLGMLFGLAIIDWDNPGCSDYTSRTVIDQRR